MQNSLWIDSSTDIVYLAQKSIFIYLLHFSGSVSQNMHQRTSSLCDVTIGIDTTTMLVTPTHRFLLLCFVYRPNMCKVSPSPYAAPPRKHHLSFLREVTTQGGSLAIQCSAVGPCAKHTAWRIRLMHREGGQSTHFNSRAAVFIAGSLAYILYYWI